MSALFLKVLVPICSVGALVGSGLGINHWLTKKPPTNAETNQPKAILIAATTAAQDLSKVSGDTITHYQCRLKGATAATPVDCSVKLLSTTASKNYETFDLLKTQPEAKLPITKSEITPPNKIFQVLADQSFVESFTAANSKLEIVNKDSTPAALANLDFLFGIKPSSSDELVGKTQYYLAQAKTFSPTSGSPTSFTKESKQYRCTSADTFPGNSSKVCEIFPFATTDNSTSATSDFSALDYAHTTTQATTVSEHKWYVIKFTTPQPLQPTTPVTDIYAHIVEPSSSTTVVISGKTTVTAPLVTKIKFEKVIPMLIAEGTTKRALLLKAQTV